MRSKSHTLALLSGVAAALGVKLEVQHEEPKPRRPEPPDPARLFRSRSRASFVPDLTPSKPPTNGKREVARRLRQMERDAAKRARAGSHKP